MCILWFILFASSWVGNINFLLDTTLPGWRAVWVEAMDEISHLSFLAYCSLSLKACPCFRSPCIMQHIPHMVWSLMLMLLLWINFPDYLGFRWLHLWCYINDADTKQVPLWVKQRSPSYIYIFHNIRILILLYFFLFFYVIHMLQK